MISRLYRDSQIDVMEKAELEVVRSGRCAKPIALTLVCESKVEVGSTISVKPERDRCDASVVA